MKKKHKIPLKIWLQMNCSNCSLRIQDSNILLYPFIWCIIHKFFHLNYYREVVKNIQLTRSITFVVELFLVAKVLLCLTK